MIEVEGKSLDEALKKAEAIIGLPKEKLKYEYDIEKTVLYGPPSKKRIVIRVDINEKYFHKILSPYLDDLKRKGKFKIDFEFEENDEEITVTLSGKDVKLFSKKGGELINALQHILNKAFSEKLKKHIILDIKGGYRKKRKEFLKKLLLSHLKKYKHRKEIYLPPLNPVDRMMIHTMAEELGLKTESMGEGYYKRIKVKKSEGD